MNILYKVISKSNAIKNKKLIEAIPKTFGLNLISNKFFFIKTEFNVNYNYEKNEKLSLNPFNKYSKFNMSSSKIILKA